MRQGAGFFKPHRGGLQRNGKSSTQRAIHAGGRIGLGALAVHGHHFHATCGATHHLRLGGVHDGRGNGRTNEQCKPHQHQSGDEFVGLRIEHVAYYR